MTPFLVRAIVEDASDGLGWVATIHLPAYPIATCGPPMKSDEVVSFIQRTIRGFVFACAKAGINDGLPADSVVDVSIEFRA